MKKPNLFNTLSFCLICLFSSSLAYAETPEEKGRKIAERSYKTIRDFGDSEVVLKMILRNAQGQESVRDLFIRALEVNDSSLSEKSMIIFKSPSDVKGTILLSHVRTLDPDDQWLYLPALKRVKRISSVNKSGPFVGSEFSFEDLTSQEVNKYDYKFLREEPCGEFKCDVVERYPKYEYSGYSKQIGWYDQTLFQNRKTEYYDRRGDLAKVLIAEDIREYDGVWRFHKLYMLNKKNGKSTDMIYEPYKFKIGLTHSDFEKGVLRRAR